MKFRPETVRWRLTLWYAALLAVPLVLFAAGSHYLLSNVLISRADWFLQEARTAFLAELDADLKGHPRTDAVRNALHDVHFRDITFAVFDPRDSLMAESEAGDTVAHLLPPPRSWPFDPARLLALRDTTRAAPVTASITAGDTTDRVMIGLVKIRDRRFTVAAVESREGIHKTLALVTVAYLIAIPFFLVIATAGGYLLAGRALAPVAMMSRQARVIGATNLHERLPVSPQQDELGELATMINELLQRLELSFEQQRRFVANASHELRTPVAIVRAEAEIALAREGRLESEYRDSLVVVRDAADGLSRTVHDLFLLARADAGNTPTQQESLYLDEVVTDVARSMQGVASQSGVRIDVADVPDAPFVGDPELLSRMLLNLVDNAVKYSPRNSTVRVELTQPDGVYRLSVADQGTGVPEDAQPHIFERFYRADKSRARSDGSLTGGAGLGLAIVRLVAEAHGGHAELERSGSNGSEFVVTLPVRG